MQLRRKTMKKLALLAVLVVGLALVAACGSGGSDDNTTGALEGADGAAEPPAATTVAEPEDSDGAVERAPVPSATAKPVATEEGEAPPAATDVPTEEPEESDVADRLEEMVLEKEDVPSGLNDIGGMGMDFDMDILPESAISGGTTYMSMFADDMGEDMIVSMVIYLEDGDEVSKALNEAEDLSFEEMEEVFDMMGGFLEMELIDTREIDVSHLGDGGFGFGMTLEMAELGTMDSEYAVWGDGPVMAVVMTMAMDGGSTADVVPLAEIMADKIEAVLG
jgi:hypothetical protein